MKSIKTYLLLLFLLILFGARAYSQTNSEKETVNKDHRFSKMDSVLVESYLTESDYNEKHGVEKLNVCEVGSDVKTASEEIYNDAPIHRNNSRNRFWDTVAVELVVDVAIHTVFLITLFWQ